MSLTAARWPRRRVAIAPLRWRSIPWRTWAEAESGRFVLWVPVLLGLGAFFYFRLPVEPPVFLPVLLVLSTAGMGGAARLAGVSSAGLLARLLCLLAGGVLLAQVRTLSIEAPQIQRALPALAVEGQITEREDRERDQRLTIRVGSIEGLPDADRPRHVRVTWRGSPTEAVAGDFVRVIAVLRPPPLPAMPAGFDYGRMLYFEEIGGVGYLVRAPEILGPGPPKRGEAYRQHIASRIAEIVPGEAGGVLIAVMTGKREAVSAEVTAQLRDTGLAHLLAISGLHMGLVCGILFVGLRMGLVLIPGLAERTPVRKWAALGALFGGLLYLSISGGAWSAQRAFIMAALGFGAVLVDRRAISMRNVALAAVVILAWRPEAVLSAGFQMSFAAVVALVAAYQMQERWQPTRRTSIARAGKFFLGLTSVSVIAGIATAPFAITHFGRIATFGLVGNLVVMPIFSLIVMPLSVIGLALMPLGLDAPFFWLAGEAVGLILTLTSAIASWPGAALTVPPWPPHAFGLVIAGGLMLCLLTAPWRLSGAALIALGLALTPLRTVPDVYIAEDASNAAVVLTPGGAMSFADRRRARFEGETWLGEQGREGPLSAHAKFGACDEPPCLERSHRGLIVAYAPTIEEAAAGCRAADIVIAPLYAEESVRSSCPALFFTASSTEGRGAMTVTRAGDLLIIQSAAGRRGQRPWSG